MHSSALCNKFIDSLTIFGDRIWEIYVAIPLFHVSLSTTHCQIAKWSFALKGDVQEPRIDVPSLVAILLATSPVPVLISKTRLPVRSPRRETRILCHLSYCHRLNARAG